MTTERAWTDGSVWEMEMYIVILAPEQSSAQTLPIFNFPRFLVDEGVKSVYTHTITK